MRANSKKNLTVRYVETVKPPKSGVAKHWDQSIPAFGLFVYPSGKRTWNVFYRVGERQRTKMLGAFPTVKLEDARGQARDILRAANKGEDLPARMKAAPATQTFTALAEEYINKHAIPNKRQWKTDQRLIKKELLPDWGKKSPVEITRQDVVAILDRLAYRGAPIQANRVHALMSKIFNWAISRDMLEYNPCQQVKKQAKERQRDRVLHPGEIKKLWKAFGKEPKYISGIMRLMLLTAQRRWEVSHMRWQDIDLNSAWWTIPAEFAKNGRSHRVPLTDAALDILKALTRKDSDGDWVFPSPTRKGQCIDNVQKAKRRVDESAKVEDFVLHDLRRTAASYTAQEGVPGNIIAKILNHAESGVTQVYNRYSYDKEKREALEIWERRLDAMVGGLRRKVQTRKLGPSHRADRQRPSRS